MVWSLSKMMKLCFPFFSPQIAKFQLQCEWKFLNFFLFGPFWTNFFLNPDKELIIIFASRLGVRFILDPIFYFPFLTKRDGISIRYMSEQFYQVLECFRRAFFTSQIFHLPARIAWYSVESLLKKVEGDNGRPKPSWVSSIRLWYWYFCLSRKSILYPGKYQDLTRSKYPKKICSKGPLHIVFNDLFPNWYGIS